MTVNPRIIKSPNGSGSNVILSDTIPSMSIASGQSFSAPKIVLDAGATLTNRGTVVCEDMTVPAGATVDNTGGDINNTSKEALINGSNVVGDIQARQIKGDVSGSVVPSGYIGEMINSDLVPFSGSILITGGQAYANVATITITTPGVYRIEYHTQLRLYRTLASGDAYWLTVITLAGTGTLNHTERCFNMYRASGSGTLGIITPVSASAIVVVATTATYALQAKVTDGNDYVVNETGKGASYFFATRIA